MASRWWPRSHSACAASGPTSRVRRSAAPSRATVSTPGRRLLAIAEFAATWVVVRRLPVTCGDPSATAVLRLSLLAGLSALSRGALVSALCLPDARLAAAMFFPSVIAAWIANGTLGLLVLAWAAPAAWRGWSARRAARTRRAAHRGDGLQGGSLDLRGDGQHCRGHAHHLLVIRAATRPRPTV